MPDDITFAPDSQSPPSVATEKALQEQGFIESKPNPNSIVIKLWKDGHISFDPESGVQIFAILALILLVIAVIAVSVVGIWTSPESTWLEKAMSSIGNAISAIVGAMVGSAITGRVRRK